MVDVQPEKDAVPQLGRIAECIVRDVVESTPAIGRFRLCQLEQDYGASFLRSP